MPPQLIRMKSTATHTLYNINIIVTIKLILTCEIVVNRVSCPHGKIVPAKELPGCADVGRYRRALDDLAAKGLVSAGTKAIPGFSGISGRGCAEYVIGPLERHGGARSDRTEALQQSPT